MSSRLGEREAVADHRARLLLQPLSLSYVQEHWLAPKRKVLYLNPRKESFRSVGMVMAPGRKVRLVKTYNEMFGIFLDSYQFEMFKYLRRQNQLG